MSELHGPMADEECSASGAGALQGPRGLSPGTLAAINTPSAGQRRMAAPGAEAELNSSQTASQPPSRAPSMSGQLGQLLSSLRSSLNSEGGRLSFSASVSQPSPPAGPAPLLGAHPEPPASAAGADVQQANDAGASPQPPAQPAAVPSSAAAEEGLPLLQAEGGAAGAPEDGDLAAAAERHRLTNLQSSVDLRAVALALERGLPYALLLLFLFVTQHILGLAVFGGLTYLLFRLNRVVRAQVALKQDRRREPLLAVAGIVAGTVPVALLVLHRRHIAGNLVLAGAEPPSKFWEVVFAVVVGDTLLRYLSVLAKVGVLLAVPSDSPARFRRRGQVLTAVEYCAALYRQLPPAPLWYHFFLQAGGSSLMRTGLSGAYLLVKAQHCFERAALAALAAQQVAVRGYGSTPSAEEVQEAGNSCPICQEAFRDPVRLSCGHIFCSGCCSEWFERERTCPMCRAAVGPASKKFKSKADGSTPLFPTIF